MNKPKEILGRLSLVFIGIVGFALMIIWQSFSIQVFHGNEYRAIADSFSTKYVDLPAERGNIYTEEGKLLATSMPTFDVRMDLTLPTLTKELFNAGIDSLSTGLSTVFKDRSPSDYKRLLRTGYNQGSRYLLIRKNVMYSELKKIKKLPIFRLGRYKGGLIAEKLTRREYPYNPLAARTIGRFRTSHGSNSVGLEATFNAYLSGTTGRRLMQKSYGGEWIPVQGNLQVEPKHGIDVVTTINVEVQDVAQNALYRAMRDNKAQKGCVVVVETKTGKVRAIVNLSKHQEGYYETDNLVTGWKVAPGSTFKLATMAALLEEGHVRLQDSVDIQLGKTWFGKYSLSDSKPHPYRNVTVKTAFERSSNVGLAKLAKRYFGKEPETFIDYLRKFRMDTTTGIALEREISSHVPMPGKKGWSGISIPWMAVGYEVEITPLQLAMFYNGIANKGKFMAPLLVSELKNYNRTIKSFEPQVLDDKVLSDSTIAGLHRLLVGVVENGTARNIRSEAYGIAGKTGTAKISNHKYAFSDRVYSSSFAGYFPAEDPLYTCVVIVFKPSNGIYYGSSVAGPVFKEISDKIHALNLFPSRENITEEEEEDKSKRLYGYLPDYARLLPMTGIMFSDTSYADWGRVTMNGNMGITSEMGNKFSLNKLKYLGLRDALTLAESEGYIVDVEGRGKVRKVELTGERRDSRPVVKLYLK